MEADQVSYYGKGKYLSKFQKWCYVKILTHLKINLSSLVRTTFYDVLVHMAEMKITCFLERSFLLTL